ncbi:DUF7006 family protein [Enterococcus sp. RIT-PI-f]|uniref:DUF7006 family protein n=1 Tax=Enterococcus sp. RIT-PI-f TaxID=1690244 RepID=UPI0006B884FF|nr:hypothetical protein [Enterococcus sp. RIT-PI-f]KPG68519.1 hypothetical protein AEQ18_14750 [Enterococcus sp. RIT-PI-f]
MELREVTSALDYLSYFNQCFEDLNIHQFPEVYAYYQGLQQDFITYSESEVSFFATLKELLLIEAKFQILLILIPHTLYADMAMSEQKLIQITEEDSCSFYRELTGQNKSSSILWSMIYISEK